MTVKIAHCWCPEDGLQMTSVSDGYYPVYICPDGHIWKYIDGSYTFVEEE